MVIGLEVFILLDPSTRGGYILASAEQNYIAWSFYERGILSWFWRVEIYCLILLQEKDLLKAILRGGLYCLTLLQEGVRIFWLEEEFHAIGSYQERIYIA